MTGEAGNQKSSFLEETVGKIYLKKIFFGHQSVGFNIMSGIEQVMCGVDPKKMEILESCDPIDYSRPVFGHSRVGKNRDVHLKIDDFSAIIDGGLGEKVDIAFFKFCYVDVESERDVEEMFNYYSLKMDMLEKKHPDIVFVHVTVPLTSQNKVSDVKNKIKDLVKKLLGRMTGKERNIRDNIKRQKFNDLLRSKCRGKHIFDLADFEAMSSDGIKNEFYFNNQRYYTLSNEYTDDGGHLNRKGASYIGERLLVFLSSL